MKLEYLIRSYSPIGLYPAESFLGEKAILFVSDEIVFSLVAIKQKAHFTSDTFWLLPEEVRLCSAISLSVSPWEFGKTIFYPNMPGFRVTFNKTTEIQEIIHSELLPLIKENMKNRNGYSFDYSLLPTFLSEINYQFNKNAKNIERQFQLFNAIDTENKLLIRGLDTLLKSNALYCHPQFLVEACSLLHISMEVSYHLVCEKANINDLKPKLKVKKAQEYLSEIFGNNYEGQKYFEPYYEDRIKIVHPINRFGLYSQPPMEPDDFFDLYEDLISLYTYLIIGHINVFP